MSPTLFAIAAFPRTGSNWLCGVRNSHPEVLCHHEVFHPHAVYYAHAFPEHRPEFLRDVARRDADPRGGQEPELTATARADSSIRKLVLRRDNRVRVFRSAKRATAVGKFTQLSYDGMPIDLDAEELQEFCAGYDAYFEQVERLVAGQDVLRLSYERLFDPGRVDEVLAFLGVGPARVELAAKHVRQSSDSLERAIANFDELAQRLAGTPLLDELLAESTVAA